MPPCKSPADFVCQDRGVIDIKGKGPTQCWLLAGERAPAPTS